MLDSKFRFRVPGLLMLWAIAPLMLGAAPQSFTVAPKVADRQQLLEPDQQHLDGFLGRRITANEKNRLLVVDEDRLLISYRTRPGVHQWDGEHVGKWLHAATLAWVNTGDAAFRAKLDRVVAGLLATQGADGDLGTYEDRPLAVTGPWSAPWQQAQSRFRVRGDGARGSLPPTTRRQGRCGGAGRTQARLRQTDIRTMRRSVALAPISVATRPT